MGWRARTWESVRAQDSRAQQGRAERGREGETSGQNGERGVETAARDDTCTVM